ncbi:uncharacterized protein [Antedon mediterranea]|uniref:uncharacterized protein isoform X2 n=1 Tax=Antedon mediterranea TaxID=105859 RepID=UPI003AF40CDE
MASAHDDLNDIDTNQECNEHEKHHESRKREHSEGDSGDQRNKVVKIQGNECCEDDEDNIVESKEDRTRQQVASERSVELADNKKTNFGKESSPKEVSQKLAENVGSVDRVSDGNNSKEDAHEPQNSKNDDKNEANLPITDVENRPTRAVIPAPSKFAENVGSVDRVSDGNNSKEDAHESQNSKNDDKNEANLQITDVENRPTRAVIPAPSKFAENVGSVDRVSDGNNSKEDAHESQNSKNDDKNEANLPITDVENRPTRAVIHAPSKLAENVGSVDRVSDGNNSKEDAHESQNSKNDDKNEANLPITDVENRPTRAVIPAPSKFAENVGSVDRVSDGNISKEDAHESQNSKNDDKNEANLPITDVENRPTRAVIPAPSKFAENVDRVSDGNNSKEDAHESQNSKNDDKNEANLPITDVENRPTRAVIHAPSKFAENVGSVDRVSDGNISKEDAHESQNSKNDDKNEANLPITDVENRSTRAVIPAPSKFAENVGSVDRVSDGNISKEDAHESQNSENDDKNEANLPITDVENRSTRAVIPAPSKFAENVGSVDCVSDGNISKEDAHESQNSKNDDKNEANLPITDVENRSTRAVIPAPSKNFQTKIQNGDCKQFRDGYPTMRSEDNEALKDNWLFYQNKIKFKPEGEFIDEIHEKWKGNYDVLEYNHNYIQWLFPIREKGVNWYSQVLQLHEAKRIQKDPAARKRFINSLEMMLGFYGIRIKLIKGSYKLCRSDDFESRFKHLNRSSHNYLRITRIFKSMCELGFEEMQQPLILFFYNEIFETKELKSSVKRSFLTYWLQTIRDDNLRLYIEEKSDSSESSNPFSDDCLMLPLSFVDIKNAEDQKQYNNQERDTNAECEKDDESEKLKDSIPVHDDNDDDQCINPKWQDERADETENTKDSTPVHDDNDDDDDQGINTIWQDERADETENTKDSTPVHDDNDDDDQGINTIGQVERADETENTKDSTPVHDNDDDQGINTIGQVERANETENTKGDCCGLVKFFSRICRNIAVWCRPTGYEVLHGNDESS